ncbi:DNA helicase, partial [Tanacetum coccineum]
LITDEVLDSNVHKRGCLHSVSTTSSLEESVQPETIRVRDILGHTASSSRMAPVNHAYLCMDFTDESYTMKDKVANRMRNFRGQDEDTLNPDIVEGIIHVLDEHNGLVRLFRTSRDKCSVGEIPGFKIRLYYKGGIRGYELPTSDILGGIVFEDGPYSEIDFDSGFYPDLVLKPKEGMGRVFCAIEQSHLDWVRNHQNDLRSDYLLGLYDAVSHGDREGIQAGSKIMLAKTFTRGPRYMYSHYLDALAIFLYTIEIQKRGLPHCHTLLWVDSSSKIRNAVEIDEYISAEIPDPMEDPRGSIGDASTSMCEKHIQVDEIQNYVYGRYVCPFEACWRIFEFPIHCREPVVQILNVHLENAQRVTFRKRDRLDIIINMPENKKTTLSKWAACEALGLLGDDKEWDIALEESIIAMKDDIPTKVSEATSILNYHVNTPELQGYILYELEPILNGFGKSVKDFGLPPPLKRLLKDLRNKLFKEEKNYKYDLLMQDAAHFDEAPTNDIRCFEALDRTLRDLMNAPAIVFGGKIVVLGGDFWQTLPVKKDAAKEELIHVSIAESYLWLYFKICKLKENMRLLRSGLSNEERERFKIFAKWLLDVGNGEIGEHNKDNNEDTSWITIPQQYCLTPDAVNAKIFATVKSATKTYLSRYEAIPMGRETSETELLYPMEYLNTITFPSFPPYELQLKVGSPIMLSKCKLVRRLMQWYKNDSRIPDVKTN